jgi:putative restriction endonuclease
MRRDLWTEEQLTLALNLYWKIPYNKISGSSNDDIKNLAKIIGKTPAALAFMLMNFTALDTERQDEGKKGKRPPGQLATKLWFDYQNQWEKLSDDSFNILPKFKDNTLDETTQIDDETTRIELDFKDIKGLDKERLVKVRVNQRDFRRRILASYNEKCCITGITMPQLLVASHIKPWAIDEDNRLNPTNGLCLSATYDKAFDAGLITVTTDYKIKLSDRILAKKRDLVIQDVFLKYEDKPISLPDRYKPSVEFLEYHNIKIFEKWNQK